MICYRADVIFSFFLISLRVYLGASQMGRPLEQETADEDEIRVRVGDVCIRAIGVLGCGRLHADESKPEARLGRGRGV
jgi:hypothetical protein